jgi:hypothetical protein
MTSKPVAFLLADLGITQSHSRPHVSNDNPFSEAQFKTLKYRPDFPGRFTSVEDARANCQRFFTYYNDEHRHSGLGLHTPADVHYGRAHKSRPSGPRCSRSPTPRTPSASCGERRHYPRCRSLRGSTRPRRRRPPLTKPVPRVPHHG